MSTKNPTDPKSDYTIMCLVAQMRGAVGLFGDVIRATDRYEDWLKQEIVASAFVPAPKGWGWPNARKLK